MLTFGHVPRLRGTTQGITKAPVRLEVQDGSIAWRKKDYVRLVARNVVALVTRRTGKNFEHNCVRATGDDSVHVHWSVLMSWTDSCRGATVQRSSERGKTCSRGTCCPTPDIKANFSACCSEDSKVVGIVEIEDTVLVSVCCCCCEALFRPYLFVACRRR